eukprot:SAG31_NODE_367_length_16811_cov_20.811584_2_plen_153_part_00
MPRDLGVMLFDSVSVAGVQMEAAAGLTERLKRRRDDVVSGDAERAEKKQGLQSLADPKSSVSTDSNQSMSAMTRQVMADSDFFSKLKTEYKIGKVPSSNALVRHDSDSDGIGISMMLPLNSGLDDLVRLHVACHTFALFPETFPCHLHSPED